MIDSLVQRLIRNWRLLAVGTLSLFVFWLLFSYGFVKIEVSEASGDITYAITSQSSNGTAESTTQKSSYRKLVRRGVQEVTVTSGNKSFFTVIHSGGFLTTKKVGAVLKNQAGREYVGYNPAGCMFMSSILYSYACQPTINLTRHTPATNTVPQLKETVRTTVGIVSASVHTAKGLVLISRQPVPEGQPANNYSAFLVDDSLREITSTELGELDKGQPYTFTRFKDGFLAYSQDFSKAWYYPAVGEKAIDLSQSTPSGKQFRFATARAYNDNVTVLFTEGEEYNFDQAKAKKAQGGSSIVRVINPTGSFTDYSFDYLVTDASVCGTDRLCVLRHSKKNMDIYSIADKRAKKLAGAESIDQILVMWDSVILQKSGRFIRFDGTTMQGFVEYSIGTQKTCGIEPSSSGYLVCVRDNKDQFAVVSINQQQEDTTNQMEQSLFGLQQLAQVKSLSLYKNIVYITLNIRNDVYNSTKRTFGYDSEEKTRARDFLNSEIDRQGIDRNKFTIIILPE